VVLKNKKWEKIILQRSTAKLRFWKSWFFGLLVHPDCSQKHKIMKAWKIVFQPFKNIVFMVVAWDGMLFLLAINKCLWLGVEGLWRVFRYTHERQWGYKILKELRVFVVLIDFIILCFLTAVRWTKSQKNQLFQNHNFAVNPCKIIFSHFFKFRTTIWYRALSSDTNFVS